MILKTFNLRSVADRRQKSGIDPGAATTCPRDQKPTAGKNLALIQELLRLAPPRSEADRRQKSGTDPGAATTCPPRDQ
jgi:hypothetical protein